VGAGRMEICTFWESIPQKDTFVPKSVAPNGGYHVPSPEPTGQGGGKGPFQTFRDNGPWPGWLIFCVIKK